MGDEDPTVPAPQEKEWFAKEDWLAMHESLLAVARHHVAVGRSGLKFAALEGGGRAALEATLHMLERCCEAQGRAAGGFPTGLDEDTQGLWGFGLQNLDSRF